VVERRGVERKHTDGDGGVGGVGGESGARGARRERVEDDGVRGDAIDGDAFGVVSRDCACDQGGARSRGFGYSSCSE